MSCDSLVIETESLVLKGHIMNTTYWNQNGKYQAEYTRLVEAVPMMGNSETLSGEMIRAATRLAYDLYNNGMGNNTSGAINFLWNRDVISRETFNTIYPYTRGRHYEGTYNGDSFQLAIENMIDTTIEFILKNNLESVKNDDDMFNYEDEEMRFCEECGDDICEYSNSICDDCEDNLNEMWEDEMEQED